MAEVVGKVDGVVKLVAMGGGAERCSLGYEKKGERRRFVKME